MSDLVDAKERLRYCGIQMKLLKTDNVESSLSNVLGLTHISVRYKRPDYNSPQRLHPAKLLSYSPVGYVVSLGKACTLLKRLALQLTKKLDQCDRQ